MLLAHRFTIGLHLLQSSLTFKLISLHIRVSKCQKMIGYCEIPRTNIVASCVTPCDNNPRRAVDTRAFFRMSAKLTWWHAYTANHGA